jgi:protein KTI12
VAFFARALASNEEKKTRGFLLAAVERLLTKEDVVIADGMNYIKGLRYQLYCVARAVGTPHCVVRTMMSFLEGGVLT